MVCLFVLILVSRGASHLTGSQTAHLSSWTSPNSPKVLTPFFSHRLSPTPPWAFLQILDRYVQASSLKTYILLPCSG